MDLGTGIAVAGIAVSLLGGFKIAWPVSKESENGKGLVYPNSDAIHTQPICSLHSGVESKLEYICEQQEEMRGDIKQLLRLSGGK
jgi:hypothetical protein